MKDTLIPIIAVVGATASGKTSLGIEIAKKYNGEVVSADSMQIYKQMDVGTAKPDNEEMQGIPHHMIDVVKASEPFSVQQYCDMAGKCIEDIHQRGKMPIIVGGTGLYIDSLLGNIQFNAPKGDENIRAELNLIAKEKGNEHLYSLLQKEDPSAAKKLHPNDVKRVIRALEIIRVSGESILLYNERSKMENKYNCLYFAIDFERAELYDRINRRVDKMIEGGLIDEVVNVLVPIRDKCKTAIQAIGYKEVLLYYDGLTTKQEMIDILKKRSRRYAKRQLSWFRRNENINWLSHNNAYEEAYQIINEWRMNQ